MKYAAIMNNPLPMELQHKMHIALQDAGFSVLDVAQNMPEDCLSPCSHIFGYFPPSMLRHADHLEWYQLPCAGVDKYVPAELYPHSHFTLTNSSGAFGPAIAEHVIMGILMLLRHMPAYMSQQAEHQWLKLGEPKLLRDQLVMIFGTGNLGQNCAHLLRGFGADVQGVNQSGHEAEGFSEVLPLMQALNELKRADIVINCLPLTDRTVRLFDAEEFAFMQSGAIFVNVGRGKTVDQTALIDALRSGHLSGAFLDVTDPEPLPQDSPLWGLDNVILTPHVSGRDQDMVNAIKIYEIWEDNLKRYITGLPLTHVVDRFAGY